MNKKSFPLFLVLLFSIVTIHAQNRAEYFKTIPVISSETPEWAQKMYSENPNVAEVADLYRLFYAKNDFVKTIHTQNHKHWMRLVAPLLDDNGFIKQPSKKEAARTFRKLKEQYQQRNTNRVPGSDLAWVPMGPFETFSTTTSEAISWHKNIYAIDQSLSNPNLLICGTEAGGIYKTLDKAANWTLISLGEVFSGGNAAVKIHPTDANNFLVASNNRIYQSTNGGATWIERHVTDGTGNEFAYAPNDHNTIFHTNSAGLFKSMDGGTTWVHIFSESCWDIDFHPTENTTVYLLKSNNTAKKSELFRSDNTGATWTLKDIGWYTPTDLEQTSDGGGKIAVTPASPDLVYVCLIGASKADDNGWIGVYKSTDKGENWSNPTGQDGGPYGDINETTDWNVAAYSDGYHQGYYNFDMEASPTDPNKLWIASIRLTESSDGGQTFQSIGAANSTRLEYIHADVQDIEVRGDEVWVASDGGVNFSDDALISHVALNKGIQAGHFWGFNTGWNEDTFTGGKYHDGTSGWFENYGAGKAYNIGGVEEASGYVHPIENRKLLYRTHYASDNTSVKTIPSTFGDAIVTHPSFPIRPNESYYDGERSGIYFDPRYANHSYTALENNVYKSIDGGVTFENIYTFPESTGMVYEMEISRSNPNILYAVYNKLGGYWDTCELWKSIDGGNSWQKTNSNLSGNNRRFRISIHPEDANIVWVATVRGNDGDKVHYTTDGGDSWMNTTTSVLDGQNITDILYQGGTNDLVYISTVYGIFYWDSSTNNWIEYSDDLPLVTKSLQLNPFYRDAELRLATYGRGVWARKMKDVLFTPIAQPITYSDTVLCLSEEVQFDCYSMLQHEGATWQWAVTPTPVSISSETARNPLIVFGVAGSYDISLTVTDAQGNSNTKTIENMITVVDDCPHCASYGNMSYATATTLVDFNSIYNVTGKTQSYTDYTDMYTTTVAKGSAYDLSIKANTDGNYTTHTKVWIDWNQDVDFDDAGETYDLGSAANTADGFTTLSPLQITVPQDAVEGTTTMRVATKYNTAPTSCETGFDGEVEDYGIVVTHPLGLLENTFEMTPILYPNPTLGQFAIDLGSPYQAVTITIHDVLGKTIQSKSYTNSQLLKVALIAADGVYLVSITTASKKAVFRLVKKKN